MSPADTRIPRAPVLALSAGLLLACLACGRAPAPNVVLVCVDTLRADALGVYGAPLATPALDRLAREGVWFDQALATSSETAPTHATLFTGQGPLRHGVLRNGTPLAQGAETLAEALRGAGWRTGAFVSSFVLDPRFGWDQGFEHYDAEFPEEGATFDKRSGHAQMFWKSHELDGFDRLAGETTRSAAAWLAQVPEPFFLFVHYFDPHAPYVPPRAHALPALQVPLDLRGRGVPGLPPDQLERAVRLYLGEVAYVDESVGALVQALDARGAERPTLLVVTADHGEGLGQHEWMAHGVSLYEELLRVPLLFRWRDGAASGRGVRRILTPVSLTDVAPTILALAGLPPLPGAEGRSLAASLTGGGEPEPRPAFAFRRRLERQPAARRGSLLSVRRGPWKYIRRERGPGELYDLASDPGETRDVGAGHAALAAELGELVDARLASMPERTPLAPLDPATRRALEALGYTE